MNDISALSPDLAQQRLAQLATLMPETVSDGKLDIAALKRVLGETEVIESGERYRLDWAGKNESYKVLQTPSSATLRPDRDKSIDFDNAPHVFIEGENLEVLKVLQKSYFGKVKLIYIDPPYNTGSDSFIYPDRFQESKEDYLRRINELNENSHLMRETAFRKNSKENGHYHSNWLSMMLPRLYVARNLLREDGVIFVSIDDNEVHNLRCLMNEIFGEENFVANVIWQGKYTTSNDAKLFSRQHETILVYARNSDKLSINLLPRTEEMDSSYKNLDDDPKGPWKATPLHAKSGNINSVYEIEFPNGLSWIAPKGRFPRYSKNRLMEIYYENGLYFNKNGGVDKKTYLSEVKQGKTVGTLWSYIEVGSTHTGNEDLSRLLDKGIFDNPKPINLLQRIIQISCSKDDLILDFFAGSSTTAHAVMQANYEDGGNRQFIMVQLPEKCEETSTAFKAGYTTIADISRERIKKVIQQIEKEQSSDLLREDNLNLGFKSFVLAPSNFKQWRGDTIETAEQLEQQIQLFAQPEKDGATPEAILFELLLKFGQPLTTPIEILEINGHQPSAISHQPSAISQIIRYKSEKNIIYA